jgi:hypothetical protein
MSELLQTEDRKVDAHVKTSETPRARDGGWAETLAQKIENDSQLRKPGTSFSAILQKHQGVRVLMVAEAVRALGAEQKVWSAKLQAYESAIDYATRLKSVSLLASYADGLPVATNVNVNASSKGDATPEQEFDRAAASPAMIEAAGRHLESLKRRHAELNASEAKTIQSQ